MLICYFILGPAGREGAGGGPEGGRGRTQYPQWLHILSEIEEHIFM